MRFFLNTTPATCSYTLSLHDALPIYRSDRHFYHLYGAATDDVSHSKRRHASFAYENSTRSPSPHHGLLVRSEEHTSDSSHSQTSYAVFCLKKKINSMQFTATHTDATH